MKLRVKIKAAGLGTIFSKLFFSKTGDFLIGLLEYSLKKSEQRPKGHSAGLHVAFLALKSISLQGFLRKSAPF